MGGKIKSHGFTLMELLVTLAILAVLASAVLPLARASAQRSQEQELRIALREIRDGIDAYKRAVDEGKVERAADASAYPKTLEDLAKGVEDRTSPIKRKLYFLRRVPRDPFCACPQSDAADTWGLRSYKSEPDNPQQGDDVYDVYSKSTGIGLNGIPYREW